MTRPLLHTMLSLLGLHIAVMGAALAAGQANSGPRHELTYYTHRDGQGHVVLMDVNRELAVNLLRHDTYVVSLAWSPDGDRLAFIAYDYTGVFRTYVLDMATRRLVTPINQAVSNEALRWSPDGRWIAFNSYVGPYPTTYVLDPVSLEIRWLKYEGMLWNSEPTWSPDGTQLAFTGRGESVEIYAIEVDCARPDCGPRLLVKHPGGDRLPAWSPVDARIAFVSDRAGRPAIFIADVGCANCGQDAQHIANLSLAGTHLAWSPDGRRLAYTDAPRGGDSGVYVADLACAPCTPDIHAISQPDHIDSWPAWSPDGRRLAFISRWVNVSDIAVLDVTCLEQVNACAGQHRLLTRRDSTVWSPVWRPGP